MTIPLVDLKAQYRTIRPEIDAAVAEVLDRGDFVLGEAVTRFEANFAAYCEVPWAVGVDTGVSGLELVLRAWGVGPGDEVITATNSFIASAAAISFTGATPVLVDVSPETCLMTVETISRALSPRTRAIIPVHLYGQPVDMDPLMELADRHGIRVLEDACQAHGARYKGRRVGSLGHAAAFSFYPGKNLGAYGDGGIVVTKEVELADSLRILRNYGQKEKYHHVALAYNRRLDTLQAAILDVKLRHLDRWNERRREVAARYDALLAGLPVRIPTVASSTEPAYHLYTIEVEGRDAVLTSLQQRGVGAGIHYPIPIHLQPPYRDLGYRPGACPIAEVRAARTLSLPLFPEIEDEQVVRVADALRQSIEAAGTDRRSESR